MIDRSITEASLRFTDQHALPRLPSDDGVRHMFRVLTGVTPERLI